MTTIGTKLKQAGYQTHMVGKWHVGMATPEHMPTGRRFNFSYGYLNAANDYYTEQFGHKCYGQMLPDLWETEKDCESIKSVVERLYVNLHKNNCMVFYMFINYNNCTIPEQKNGVLL